MKITDILNLNKSSSVELVNKINEELSKSPKDLVIIFLLSVFYVNRYSRLNHNVTKEMLPELAVSLFVDIFGKKKVTINELGAFVRSEIWGTYEKVIAHRIDTDEPYASHYDQYHFTDEEATEKAALLELARSKIIDLAPIRLVPIIRYYIDTGILATTMLDNSDKFLVLMFLHKLGARMTINSDGIGDLIPKDPKGKALFLSSLCNKDENLYILLNLFGDLDKLFILSELFGGQQIKIPTPDELVTTIEDLAKSSDKFKGNDPVSDEFLSLFVETDVKSAGIQLSVLDHLRLALDMESVTYEKVLSRLNQSPESRKVLQTLTSELGATTNILDRISRVSKNSQIG